MRAIIVWALICVALLLAGLSMANLPHNLKGAALMTALFCVNIGLFVKICRGSR